MLLHVCQQMIGYTDILTEADKAIGDGDHGIGMARGFEAVSQKLAAGSYASLDQLLKTAGMTLITSIGGAAGVVFGTWFRDGAKNLGGGQFFSHGCHYVDILLWFLGKPVEGAHIGTNHGTPWMEREGTSNAIMKFENGAMGYHFGTWGARGTEHGYCFQLHMTKGMLDYHRASGKIVLYQNCNPDLPAEMPPEDKVRVLWEDPDRTKKTQFETRHFLECVKTGKRPDTDGRRSVQSLRCIWRMYDAEQKGVMADLRGLGLE